jgi:hypothetical protein
MLNNILTTTVNPIPMQILDLQNEIALLSETNLKTKRLLYLSVGVILIFSIITIIQKNEDRD